MKEDNTTAAAQVDVTIAHPRAGGSCPHRDFPSKTLNEVLRVNAPLYSLEKNEKTIVCYLELLPRTVAYPCSRDRNPSG
jgi:hypothetical protein